MASALPSPEVLSSAMGRLTVRPSPVAWDRSNPANSVSSSWVESNLACAPAFAQVQIRWKPILLDVVQTLGGTEPVYRCNEIIPCVFQVRMNFSLPLNRDASSFKDMNVAGTMCSTRSEAESEASIAALQELQYGCLSIRVMDVSRTRIYELERKCRETLAAASELYHGIKLVLLDWEKNMDRAEGCYRPMYQKVLESMSHSVSRNNGDISSDVASYLFSLMSNSYLKLKELSSEADKANINIARVHDHVEFFFSQSSIHEVNESRGCLPSELKLRMKLVLQEMMSSLGWPTPVSNIIHLGQSTYICQTSLFLGEGHIASKPRMLTVAGSEAFSIEEAVENSCKATILILEREESICLVDLNYNHRSNGELYVIESKEALDVTSLIGSKVLAEWGLMVNRIQICEDHCLKAIANHTGEEQTNPVQHIKFNSVKAVTGLHKICLAGLEASKRRLKNAVVSMDE